MTTALIDVMTVLIKNYPKERLGDLSTARLTKMVYLSDWHFANKNKRQITDIKWYFDTYGPFVKDIENTALKYDEIFVTDFGNNQFGQPKMTFWLRDPNQKTDIGKNEEISLKHIIKITSERNCRDFLNLVSSTFPVRSSERYSELNLPNLVDNYKKEQRMQSKGQRKRFLAKWNVPGIPIQNKGLSDFFKLMVKWREGFFSWLR